MGTVNSVGCLDSIKECGHIIYDKIKETVLRIAEFVKNLFRWILPGCFEAESKNVEVPRAIEVIQEEPPQVSTLEEEEKQKEDSPRGSFRALGDLGSVVILSPRAGIEGVELSPRLSGKITNKNAVSFVLLDLIQAFLTADQEMINDTINAKIAMAQAIWENQRSSIENPIQNFGLKEVELLLLHGSGLESRKATSMAEHVQEKLDLLTQTTNEKPMIGGILRIEEDGESKEFGILVKKLGWAHKYFLINPYGKEEKLEIKIRLTADGLKKELLQISPSSAAGLEPKVSLTALLPLA